MNAQEPLPNRLIKQQQEVVIYIERYLNNYDMNYYFECFATLIIQNILKYSNYCFDSLAIRLQSNDLKTPYPNNWTQGLQG